MRHASLAILVLAFGCSTGNPGRTGSTTGTGGTTAGRGTTTSGGTTGTGGACQGLGCYKMNCGTAPQTTVSGRVTAPNGIDPVVEALVYVPTTVPEFSATVQCEVCDNPIGGTPVVQTTTNVDGTFVLKDVPVTTNVPIVVQKGRFRKQFSLDITGCTNNPLTAAQTTLPRNKLEGDLPRMAVGTGDYDQIECVLRSIGIDETEFTRPQQDGVVHLYTNFSEGSGETLEDLLMDYGRLSTYNLVFINCSMTSLMDYANPTLVKQNLFKYVQAGGRLYVTDWAYNYMEQVPEFAPYIFFEGKGDAMTPQPEKDAWWAWNGDDIPDVNIVDDNLKQWMAAANASANGKLTIQQSWAISKGTAADTTTYPHTVWVSGKVPDAAANDLDDIDRPMTVTYDYNMCGKVLWSSYHTQHPGAIGEDFFSSTPPAFPKYCKSTAQTMIPQEKILEYLIFQISSCVAPVA